MPAEALAGFLRIGIFVGGCGALMLFFQPPESAQFVLSLCSALMGGAMVLGVLLLNRNRRWPGNEDDTDI
jgi:Flp pilus assembly protein protease CpaA